MDDLDEIDLPGTESLRRKASKVRALFSTDEGREVLRILMDEFDPTDLRATGALNEGQYTHDTFYNLGRRDALRYLVELFEFGRWGDI